MQDNEEAQRIRALEVRLALLETRDAVQTEKIANLESKLSSLSGGVSRGLWILGGGFIAAFVSFVVKGGIWNG